MIERIANGHVIREKLIQAIEKRNGTAWKKAVEELAVLIENKEHAIRLAEILLDRILALGVLVGLEVGRPIRLGLGTRVDGADGLYRVAGGAHAAVIDAAAFPVGVIGEGGRGEQGKRDADGEVGGEFHGHTPC